jgi:NAD-dependent SIR2 family protein deacetylase
MKMVIKLIDRDTYKGNIKVGLRCNDCGEILDYEKYIHEMNFRSNKKQIILCDRCAAELKSLL